MKDFFRFLWRAWKYRLHSDRAEIEKILCLVKKGMSTLDIGAHKGAYTYWLSRAVGLTGHVDAFEPQLQLAEQLKKLIDAAGICNTDVHQIALSNKTGTAKLVIPAQRGGTPGASIAVQQPLSQAHTLDVQTTTIDEFFDGHFARPISFIKCDAEGHELEIFQGGEKTIEADKPTILFECEARHHNKEKMLRTFEYLLSKKYFAFFFYNSELFPLADFDVQVHQAPELRRPANNFLFIPMSKKL